MAAGRTHQPQAESGPAGRGRLPVGLGLSGTDCQQLAAGRQSAEPGRSEYPALQKNQTLESISLSQPLSFYVDVFYFGVVVESFQTAGAADAAFLIAAGFDFGGQLVVGVDPDGPGFEPAAGS